jgi:hypothetical protein
MRSGKEVLRWGGPGRWCGFFSFFFFFFFLFYGHLASWCNWNAITLLGVWLWLACFCIIIFSSFFFFEALLIQSRNNSPSLFMPFITYIWSWDLCPNPGNYFA